MKQTVKLHIKESSPRRSLLWRVAAYMLSISILAVLTLSLTSFFIARSYVEKHVLSQVSSLVAGKEDLLEGTLQHNRENATLIASRQDILRMVENGDTTGLDALYLELIDQGMPIAGMTLFTRWAGPIGHVSVAVTSVPSLTPRTSIEPHVDQGGWKGYTVFAQVRDAEHAVRGYLAVRYDAEELLRSIVSAEVLGSSAEVLLARENAGELSLFQQSLTAQFQKPLSLGSLEDQYRNGDTLALALMHEEGVQSGEDYTGKQVFASYRYLPTFGWALVVKVDRKQALSGIFTLGVTLGTVSAVLLFLAGLLSVVLARDVTEPLRRLTHRVATLGPGHWNYRKCAHTGDEVEVLDRTTANLAKRLKCVYEHLEEEVRIQTAALKEQYEKDHTILASIEHGILVMDKNGFITDMNAAAKSLLGCDPTSTIGTSVTGVLRLHQHRKPVSKKLHPVMQCLSKKTAVRPKPEIRWSILHRTNNTLIPVILSVTPILQSRKLFGAIAVFYDITEDRRVDYLKSEFVSLASHQLRTPLSAIEWYVELFTSEGEKKLSAEQKEYLNEIDIATKRMTKLVDALLHAARLEGQTIKPKMENIELCRFTNDMAEELRSLAKASQISCDVQIPKKRCALSTDPILLHIIFQNLFSNAVKYTRAGGSVRISLQEKRSSCEITVSDTGIGIPKKDQARIFERLFRAANVLKVDTDGNGLGLYISHMAIETLGGSLRFTSAENKGTTFVISLPKHSKKH